jgi:hypothetical protein
MLHLPIRLAETCDLGDLFAFYIVIPGMFVLWMFEEPAFWVSVGAAAHVDLHPVTPWTTAR